MEDMANTPESIATELTPPQRALLKCVGSGWDWGKAHVKPATIQLVILKGLVERDKSNRLVLTDQGRAVLAVLTKE